MLFDQFFDEIQVFECLGNLFLGMDVVARHRDGYTVTPSVDLRVDLLQLLCGSKGLGLTTLNGIFILEEGLPDWIGVADF